MRRFPQPNALVPVGQAIFASDFAVSEALILMNPSDYAKFMREYVPTEDERREMREWSDGIIRNQERQRLGAITCFVGQGE